MNKRHQYQDFTTLFQFLNTELSIPCLPYNIGFIRVFNALISDVKLDVYIDEQLLAREFSYKQFSYYIPVSAPKTYTLRVFNSSNLNAPIIDMQIEMSQASVQTFVVSGNVEVPKILKISTDPNQPTIANKSLIRYVNLLETDITVNVISNNTMVSSKNIRSYEYNKYEAIDSQDYRFQFVPVDNPESISQTYINHSLRPTRIYTFYIIGSLDPTSSLYANYPLEIVVSVDMTTMLKKCPPDMKRFLLNL